jgi:preprotein translocase subunit SecD
MTSANMLKLSGGTMAKNNPLIISLTSAALMVLASTLAAAEPALVLVFKKERLGFGPGDIVETSISFDMNNQPGVIFRMSKEKARAFGELTTRNVAQSFDLVVCGKVISSPVIMEPILGGSGMVSGGFSVEEAKKIADQLKTGTCA